MQELRTDHELLTKSQNWHMRGHILILNVSRHEDVPRYKLRVIYRENCP